MQSLLLRRTFPSVQRTLPSYTRCFASQPPPPPPPPPSNTKPSDPQKQHEGAESGAATSQDATNVKADTTPPSPTTLSLDFSPLAEQDEQQDQSQRTGAKSSKDSLSSIERKRRVMSRATLAVMGLGAIAGVFYLGRDWEDDELREKRLKREEAPNTRMGRTKERFTSLFDYFSKPTWEELLPPSVPPYQKPYTLLLSIDDLLVTSTWDRKNGWRTAKRPGVDYFLAYLSQFFEIVVFTTQNHYTAIPILEKLDPYNFYITYKLFRESTRSINGSIKKDLTYLNRDLSKVIMLDTHPDHVSLQPENSIILPKWDGDPRDKGLISMIPFLESIAIYNPADVRPIIQAFHGKSIPVEYAKQEAEAKQKFLEEWRKSGKAKVAGSFTLSSLFGGQASDTHTPEPLTYLEQKRKEAQQHYLEEQKYIRENRAYFDRLIEEDRQAAAAQMSGNLFSVLGTLTGAPPPPPPQAQSQEGMGEVKVPVQDGSSSKASPTSPK